MKEKILRRLLECPKLDVKVRNSDLNTPLHYGAKRCATPGFGPYFEALLKKGKSATSDC